MTLDQLYTKVTDAIYRAQLYEGANPPRAAMAYFLVSTLEEEIASLLGPADEEGAVARRGVVTAALSAGLPSRAFEFAEQYLAQSNVPEHLRVDLEALREEARGAMPTDTDPLVVPRARFSIQRSPEDD